MNKVSQILEGLKQDRLYTQKQEMISEGVKMYTEYKYHVMCDRGNGKPEVAAWYDDKKKADKEANFLRSKGYKVEIKVNEEVIDEGRYVKDKDRMKALKNVFKKARGWEVSKTNPCEYELGYISFDVADEIARYCDNSDPDDEFCLDEDEYEASDGRSDLDKFVKVLKSDSNISKFDVHIAEKLRDLVDEFNKGYKGA